MALVQHIEANGVCDVSVSEAVIRCLDHRLIPATSTLDHQSVVAATGAMCIISTQCRVIICEGADKRSMVKLLVKHYLDLVKWFRFLEGKGNFTLTSAAFLFMMTNMGEDLANTVMGSRSAVQLVLSLWKSKDSSGRHFTTDEDDDIRCPMLLLLRRIVHDKTGRSTLLSLLHTRPSRATQMARTIRHRIQELGDRHSKGDVSGAFASQHILDLVHFMRTLLYQAVDTHAYFLDPLQSPRLLFGLCRSLDIILHEGRGAFSNWEGFIDIFCFLFELLPDIGHGCGSPVAKLRSSLEGGLLRISIILLLLIPPSSPYLSFVLDCITKVATYVPYSGVALSLSNAISVLDVDMVAQASKRVPRFASCWAALEKARGIWDSEPERSGMGQLCHCIEVPWIPFPCLMRH